MLHYLFISLIPVIILAITIWLGIRKKAEYGKRPKILLSSILVISFLAVFVFLFDLQKFTGTSLRKTFIIDALVLFSIAFFLLEYSVHHQRITMSYLTDEVRPTLMKLVKYYLLLIPGLIIVNYFMYQDYLLDLFRKPQQLENLATQYSLVMLIVLNFVLKSQTFEYKNGILRKEQYPFKRQALLALFYMGAFLLSRFPFAEKIPYFMLYILVATYASRLYGEYLYFRTKHMGMMLKKQETQRRNSTSLINKIIVSEQKEDYQIIRDLITQTMKDSKQELINDSYCITGIATYRYHNGEFMIDSEKMIIGYCMPLKTINNAKKVNTESLHKMIMDTRYNKQDLLHAKAEDLHDFGEKYIKEMLETYSTVIVNPIPDCFKGLQKMIMIVPVLNNNEISGFQVVFKDSYENLYPFEKNALDTMGYDLNTLFSIDHGKIVQQEKNRLAGEMDIAHHIQTSIVPSTIEVDGYTVACNMETATEVGGDAYDFVNSKYGNLFAIGDVSGHGLPSGIMALIFITTIQAVSEASKALDKELTADMVYDILNQVICTINTDRIGSDKFMTANIFMEKNGSFIHSGAHEIALLYKKDSDKVVPLTDCTTRTAFLGLSNQIQSDTSLGGFDMAKGDVLVLYSDGLIEAKDETSDQYGMDRLTELLMVEKDSNPDEILSTMMEKVKDFAKRGDIEKNQGHLADDISMMVIRKD